MASTARHLTRWSASVVSLILLLLAAPRECRAQREAFVEALSSVGTTVRDMDRSVAFYRDVLEFHQDFDVEVTDPEYDRLVGVFASRVRIVGLSLGPSRIELLEFLTPKGRAYPPDSRSNDHWFQHLALVVTDIERATERLRAHDVQFVSPIPQRFADGSAYLYFRDPDGHPLELAEFPAGPPVDSAKLFQRIDHTALVVEDLDESIAFYRRLGFRLERRFESASPAQERLNNVFGAHLEIASLTPPGGGIGVELLEYLTPSGGRPFPADARPNDGIHRQLTLTTEEIATAFGAFRSSGKHVRTPRVSSFTVAGRGERRSFYVADPTGHLIEIRQRGNASGSDY